MTYREALKQFNKDIRPLVAKDDKPALGQAWSIYIDDLHRDNIINEKQANLWDNPFYN